MSFTTSVLLYYFSVLLGAAGALCAGHSGTLAFALEGIMTAGGLAGLLCSHLPVAAALLAAGLTGAVYALLLGWAVHRRGDTLLAGMALNGLAAALTMIIARLIGGVSYSRKTFQLIIGEENVTVFLPMGLVLFLACWLLLFHTRWGLRLRLCGQSGEAAEKMGVNVGGMRCLGLLLCGFLGGIGGLAGFIALGGGWRMEWGLGGLGFLALAAAALGRWRPWGVFFSAALFALARAGCQAAAAAGWGLPEGLFLLLPFLLALCVLAIVGKRDGAPGDVAKQKDARPMQS